MKYCALCLIPDSRPNIIFDGKGVCNACRAFEQRKEIDWKARAKNFRKVVEHAKKHSLGYDCVIPVSGGKDSIWQVQKCLEHGLNPLCVTWKTPARTKVGQHNLDCLIAMGVDHIDYQINPKTERKFMWESFKRFGSTAIPMHMAIFSIPLTIAVRFKIPLIVWGENSAFEYGGTKEEQRGFELNASWLKKFGVMHGTSAKDWVGTKLTKREMTPYFYPSKSELRSSKVLAVFLGYYYPWDPENSFAVAKKFGFNLEKKGPRTGLYSFADIDDDFISIHHYLKWYKFGFTRLFDNLSIEIRHGRMSREKAIDLLAEYGDQKPIEDIAKFCEFAGVKAKMFFKEMERFRNRKIWKMEKRKWTIPGFIVKDWRW